MFFGDRTCVLTDLAGHRWAFAERDVVPPSGKNLSYNGRNLRSRMMLETYLEILDLCYFEIGEAFKDLADDNVWKRPAANLLSIGEIAGHVAFWDGLRLSSDGSAWHPDLENCPLESPFLDPRFSYYPDTLANEPSDAHKAMTAEDVYSELKRLHTAAAAILRERNPDLDATDPATHFKEHLKYGAFHISYHTGQIYTTRYLLGETPPDN